MDQPYNMGYWVFPSVGERLRTINVFFIGIIIEFLLSRFLFRLVSIRYSVGYVIEYVLPSTLVVALHLAWFV
jgi:hypothetical protein